MSEQNDALKALESLVICEYEKHKAFLATPSSPKPFIVGLTGVPGSGKSTLSAQLRSRLQEKGISTEIIPMDGYHIPLKKLSEEEKYFRGAVNTFDLSRFKSDIERLSQGRGEVLMFPGFNHEIGDPEEEIHVVTSDTDIVLVEGLYLLIDGLKQLFDYRIFIDADIDRCISQLKLRNLVIPGYNEDEISVRCDVVDRGNATFVETLRANADSFFKGPFWN